MSGTEIGGLVRMTVFGEGSGRGGVTVELKSGREE
jgi:hypothetical protein